jgi:hypothetical protein
MPPVAGRFPEPVPIKSQGRHDGKQACHQAPGRLLYSEARDVQEAFNQP